MTVGTISDSDGTGFCRAARGRSWRGQAVSTRRAARAVNAAERMPPMAGFSPTPDAPSGARRDEADVPCAHVLRGARVMHNERSSREGLITDSITRESAGGAVAPTKPRGVSGHTIRTPHPRRRSGEHVAEILTERAMPAPTSTIAQSKSADTGRVRGERDARRAIFSDLPNHGYGRPHCRPPVRRSQSRAAAASVGTEGLAMGLRCPTADAQSGRTRGKQHAPVGWGQGGTLIKTDAFHVAHPFGPSGCVSPDAAPAYSSPTESCAWGGTPVREAAAALRQHPYEASRIDSSGCQSRLGRDTQPYLLALREEGIRGRVHTRANAAFVRSLSGLERL